MGGLVSGEALCKDRKAAKAVGDCVSVCKVLVDVMETSVNDGVVAD